MKKLLRYYLFLLFFLGIYSLHSQTLTISSGGDSGLSSGTNWSISGNILTVTGAANIKASVIVAALANGNLTVVGNTNNFAVTVSEAITATGNNTLTVGSATNTGTITFNAATSFAGPINIYGGYVNINGNLTSSATGDIFIKGIASTNPSIWVQSGKTITKSGGTGTLTMQGHGRVSNSGSITTSGTGVLNVIFWSDFDGDNVGGGVSHNGTISTNGGHVWMGGSNSNGGSYTWNSLAVGDGPSVGAASSNANALDIFGNITTSGGDFLAWAGNGVSSGIDGIGTITGYSVNVGSGDIVLITDEILGTGPSLFFNQSGGSFTLVPNDGSFGTSFNWDGATNTVSGYGTGWNFGGYFNYLWLENPASLTSLTIGKYEGMLSGSTPVVLSNSSDVTFSNTTATSIAGPISIYGGDITVSQNLTSSLADADILLQATGAIILSASRTLQTSGGDVTLNATSGGTATTAQSAIYLNGSSQILSNGGNITLGGGYSGTEGNLYAATTISGIGYAVRMDDATVLNAAGATFGGNINVYGRKVLSYGDGVYLNSVNISTIGNGTIGINGDSFGGFYNGTTYFGGITFENQASTIQTVNGNLTLKGILTNSQSTNGNGINFYRSTGSTGLTRHIQLLSRTGAIEVTGDAGSTIGGGIGSSSWGNVYFGSPADASFTATGDVTMSYSKLVGANANGFKVKTTGDVSYLPTGTSFTAAQTIPQNANYILADGASSLTIGKTTNTSDITMATSTTVAGPISVYGGAITFSQNLSTTNTTTGNILLNGTTISGTGNIAIAAGRTATINVSSNSTYDGIVSGSGSGLTKSGIGMLTLTKDHTYSGATTVTAGDLQVGTGGSVSQASSGSISNTTAVAVASGSKLILTPNENILFAAPISGAGGVEIKGASGRYLNTWLTGTPTLFATNTSVLEVLTRITGGLMDGGAVTGAPACGAYQKSYSAATNTATLQLQVYNGASPNYYTKCVFVQLSQSGSNVMIQANTSIYSSGAGYKSGNVLGTNMGTGGTSMALATSAASAGYGIAEVYMSGKVNFTGNLTYSGNTVLSNTVTSVSNSTNISSYTSKGTQEITDASTGFPSASTVINDGLVIFNRATPLTIASNMQGTEEVLQVGAAITLTGANTHSGNTTIDLNKSLNIGSGGTIGSITGNIINYGTVTFNRSNSSSYSGIISGSGALVKSGANDFTLTGLNTYTGSTTINDGRLILERDVPATCSSGYSGIGTLVIQPSSNSFTSAVSYPIAGFTVSSSIGGLTIGKTTNSSNITFANATTIAGPITAYGGTITLNDNLTTTNNGNISLYSDNALGLSSARTITAAGTFTYASQGASFLSPVTYPIPNLTLSCTGLTIGKSGNTSAISVASTTTINGPITLYGGVLGLNSALSTSNTSTGDISLNGSSISGNANLTLAAGRTATLNLSSTTSYSGVISGSGSHLIKSGIGDLTLTGANTLSGTTTVSAGMLNLNRTEGSTLPDVANIIVSADINASPGTLNFASNQTINNLSIASNALCMVNPSKKLTVNGVLTNNGTFTINSGSTLVQGTSSTLSGSGNYDVLQNITGSGGISPNGRFWYLGSPLSNGSSSALLSYTGDLVWKWNESSFAYETVSTGQTLTQGKSYVLRSAQSTGVIHFLGTGLSNGTVNVTGLTRSGTTQNYRGCHLISNPYPSYLDWNSVTKTNIGTTMYLRTAVNTTYDILETFNSTGNVATNNSGTPLTQYIAPMQGFWVKVAADGQTGSLTMDNSMRSHQPTGSGLRSTAQDFPAFLRFNMIDGQNKDQVILLMSPDASMSLDNFDSEKMSASGFAQFYSTVNATKLVINGMKNVKAKTSVPLTLVMPTSKSYTFQAEEFNIEDGLILLEDKQEGVIQDLTINPTYSFFGNAGTNATRFVVHFQLATAPVLVGGPQELESLGSEDLTTDNIQIVSNNQGTVIVRLDEGFKPEGSIRIFDASGRLVEQTDFNDQETTIQLNEQAGMYFVEVSAGKLMVKKKIVIN